MLRILVVIFDGLADRPVPELGGRTPLEAAHTPNLNRLASEGINGMLHAKSPGYPLGSPLALHLLFGYPEADFPDRGPLIARARGIPFGGDDVVLTARFASAQPRDGQLVLTERFIRGREAHCAELAGLIATEAIDGLTFRFHYTGNGDGILVIEGGASFAVTDTDPLGLDLPVLRSLSRADAPDPALARRTADALNTWLAGIHLRLREHALNEGSSQPVNAIITKWAGPSPAYEPFAEKWGMRAASLPDEEVVTGLVQEMGLAIRQVEDRDPESDVVRRLDAARALFDEGYEFVHLHAKYPDPTSHRNLPEEAMREIEALDRGWAHYWDTLGRDDRLVTVVTTDHATPSVWVDTPRGQFNDQHGGEPFPVIVRAPNARVDDVVEFGERPGVHGGLGHLRGEDFMPVLLNAAERTNMYEMRPTPVKRLYRPKPGDIEPLRIE